MLLQLEQEDDDEEEKHTTGKKVMISARMPQPETIMGKASSLTFPGQISFSPFWLMFYFFPATFHPWVLIKCLEG